MRREGNQLKFCARGHVNVHGMPRPRWGASVELPGQPGVRGAPGFVQSVIHGDFEVVAPLTVGGLAHWCHNNGVHAPTWHGPTGFGPATSKFAAASLVQNDNGHLEVIAVRGPHLVHFWRDAGNAWHGPIDIPGTGVSGQPGFVQADDGTFQVVAPLSGGGLGHWSRGKAGGWSGPKPVGGGTVREVGLIQGNFGAGNLDVVARLDDGLDHYFAQPAAGSWTWHGPTRPGVSRCSTPRSPGAARSRSSPAGRRRSTSRRSATGGRSASGSATAAWGRTPARS